MNVRWIIRAPIEQKNNSVYSPYAGIRLRTIVCVTELAKLEHTAGIVSPAESTDLAQLTLDDECERVILGLFLPTITESFIEVGVKLATLVGRLRSRGIKVVIDICDDHFEDPQRGAFYARLVPLVDAVTVNTAVMAEIVRTHTPKPVHVIGDPYASTRAEPAFTARRRPRPRWWPFRVRRLELVWFGHQSNLETVYRCAATLLPLAKRVPLSITLVSAPGFGGEQFCETFNQAHVGDCELRFVAWSMATTAAALATADLVILPSDVTSRAKSVKSANRLIDALRAGRFPIAHPLPAYREFADHAWVGEDLAAGIEWALHHPAEVVARTRAAQDYIEAHYAPGVIGARWAQVLAEVA